MNQIRLYNIVVSLDDDPERVFQREARKRLGIQGKLALTLVKRGVDARRRTPNFNCTIDVTLPDGTDRDALVKALGHQAGIPPETPDLAVPTGDREIRGRVVVVGSGPAGGFAAWVLAMQGYRPLVLERGKPAPERLRQIGRFNAGVVELDPNNNTLFGEGGAGSFSDGKLYTSNRKDPFLPRVLEVFVECGAPANILVDQAPHVGTDILSRVVVEMRRRMTAMGAEFRFDAQVTDIDAAPDLTSVTVNDSERIETNALVLAPGHSARDTFAMLQRRGVSMDAKPFQMGVRIEHPQEIIDRAQLGRFCHDERLTPAAYDLASKNGPGLYSFCMCPGGITMCTVSERGHLNTNGMSFSPRASRYANSALVTTFTTDDFGSGALDGIAFQRQFEARAFEAGGSDYTAPAQPVTHYLRAMNSPRNMKGTYARGRAYRDLAPLLPEKLNTALRANLPVFDQRLRGFVSDQAILHAVEARASSPVRINRHRDSRQSTSVAGLYPCGEGAGFAGGIVSAALDGIHSAHAICGTFAATSAH